MRRFFIDLGILGASIAGAVVLVQSGLINTALSSAQANTLMAAFISGLFFTSVFTTAPAVAVFGTLVHGGGNLVLISLVGAAGAVLGDLLLFMFVRDRVSDDITHMLKRRTVGRLRALLRRPTFKWFVAFIGGLLIAWPLPTDELGMALLGMTKLKIRTFIVLAFCFNAAGIFLVGLATRSFM